MKYWLTFNEINSALHFPLMSAGIWTPKEKLSKQDLYQAMHHELVASALAVKIGHEINPEFKIGCMILGVPNYPLTPMPSDVLKAVEQDRGNLFFADIHARGEYPKYMNRYFKENNIEIKFEDVIKYGENVVARPHIAKAIIDAGYPYTQDYIFDNFIGKGKPAYIETTKITVKEGVDLLHKYNAIVFLAHPILINNSNISDFLQFNFDGIEGVYFLNSKTQEKELLDFANKNNLLVSAGSDCHGDFINDTRHGDIGDMNLDENYINLILEKLNA